LFLWAVKGITSLQAELKMGNENNAKRPDVPKHELALVVSDLDEFLIDTWTKAPIRRVSDALQILVQGGNFNQPYLADLLGKDIACTDQPPQVLDVIAGVLGSILD
jgi:hypothetical protein